MGTPNWERNRATAVRTVRECLRLIDSLAPGQTAGSPEEVAAIRAELEAWKHGAPTSAGPTFAPSFMAHKMVRAWPEDDPVRQLINQIYDSARTPLP